MKKTLLLLLLCSLSLPWCALPARAQTDELIMDELIKIKKENRRIRKSLRELMQQYSNTVMDNRTLKQNLVRIARYVKEQQKQTLEKLQQLARRLENSQSQEAVKQELEKYKREVLAQLANCQKTLNTKLATLDKTLQELHTRTVPALEQKVQQVQTQSQQQLKQVQGGLRQELQLALQKESTARTRYMEQLQQRQELMGQIFIAYQDYKRGLPFNKNRYLPQLLSAHKESQAPQTGITHTLIYDLFQYYWRREYLVIYKYVQFWGEDAEKPRDDLMMLKRRALRFCKVYSPYVTSQPGIKPYLKSLQGFIQILTRLEHPRNYVLRFNVYSKKPDLYKNLQLKFKIGKQELVPRKISGEYAYQIEFKWQMDMDINILCHYDLYGSDIFNPEQSIPQQETREIYADESVALCRLQGESDFGSRIFKIEGELQGYRQLVPKVTKGYK